MIGTPCAARSVFNDEKKLPSLRCPRRCQIGSLNEQRRDRPSIFGTIHWYIGCHDRNDAAERSIYLAARTPSPAHRPRAEWSLSCSSTSPTTRPERRESIGLRPSSDGPGNAVYIGGFLGNQPVVLSCGAHQSAQRVVTKSCQSYTGTSVAADTDKDILKAYLNSKLGTCGIGVSTNRNEA